MFYKGDMAQLYTHKNYYDYNLKSTLQTNQPGLKVNCSENEIVIKKVRLKGEVWWCECR